jgi:mycofactocin precursor
MTENPTATTGPVSPATAGPVSPATADADADEPGEMLEQDLMVEEVSIDGMCGVY